MAKNIKLEIVTPEKCVIDASVKIVMAPGVLGEFGVLSGHTPFLTVLKIGQVRYVNLDGREEYVFVNGGFAEALPEKVIVLTDSAENKQDVDIDRARSAAERAKNRLSQKNILGQKNSKNINFDRARAALLRAVERIRIFGID